MPLNAWTTTTQTNLEIIFVDDADELTGLFRSQNQFQTELT